MRCSIRMPAWCAAAVLCGCGPPPAQGGSPEAPPHLTCGGGGSLGGLQDPGFTAGVVLEPVQADCSWESTSFPMYRRVQDGALFYRPLFVVVQPPELDALDDPDERTLMFHFLVRAPDPRAACRQPPDPLRELALQTAEPLPLTNAKLKLESPVATDVCEMGDGASLQVLGDQETVRVTFAEAGDARRVMEALEQDPSLLALRVYWESVGSILALRCSIDGESLELLERGRIESEMRSADLAPAEDGTTWILDDGQVRTVRSVVQEALDEVLRDFPPRTCPADTAEVLAGQIVESWKIDAPEIGRAHV